jgi:hypothetical protein
MDKTSKEYTKQEKATEESIKLIYDLFKHITILTTGIILILITFLEKLFQNPSGKYLVSISFIFFIISIILALITMAFMAQGVADLGELDEFETKIGRWTFLTTLGSFVLGIISFVIFALVNFNK